jgi:hypothetical protein
MHLRVEFKADLPIIGTSPFFDVEIDSLKVTGTRVTFERSDKSLGNWFELDHVAEWSVS